GEFLKSEPCIDSDHPEVSALARRLVAGHERPHDQCEALFRHVDQEIADEPGVYGPGISSLECLQNGAGDSGGKARLLVALCRNPGLPARLVTGLALRKGSEQLAHVWAEAWVDAHWLPMCPFHHHFGRVPPTYFVLQFGDVRIVRGRSVKDLNYAFLVERAAD